MLQYHYSLSGVACASVIYIYKITYMRYNKQICVTIILFVLCVCLDGCNFMSQIMKRMKKDSAVSPVVGVMLMLVVTIIIAAVVAAFAGGLISTTSVAPKASLETTITLDGGMAGNNAMTIKHLGGDPIDTADVKLVTSWTNRTTKEVNFRETTALPYTQTQTAFNTAGNLTNLSLVNANVNSSWGAIYQDPYFVVPGTMPSQSEETVKLWFGEYIFKAGDILKADASLDPSVGSYADHSLIKNSEWLSKDDVVTVQLIHIPSGNLIYEKDVYVTEA